MILTHLNVALENNIFNLVYIYTIISLTENIHPMSNLACSP